MKRLLAIFCLSFIFFQCHEQSKDTATQKLKHKLEPSQYLEFMKFGLEPEKNVIAYKNMMEAEAKKSIMRGPSKFDSPWRLEGPTNISGRVNTLATDPNNSNVIYAGFSLGGVFKTTDQGKNWYPIFDDVPYSSIGKIAIDPNDSNIIYVGTGDPNIPSSMFIGGGVFKSLDAGNTWDYIGLAEDYVVSDILINPYNSQEILVSTMGFAAVKGNQRGLYKSYDGGNTWDKTLFLSEDAGIIDMATHPDKPNTILAAGWNRHRTNTVSEVIGDDGNIYYSIDFGQTWTPSIVDKPEVLGRVGVCFSETDDQVAFAMFVNTDQNLHSIHKSIDGGKTFEIMQHASEFAPNNILGSFGWYFGKIRSFFDPLDQREKIFLLGVEMSTYDEANQVWENVVPPWYTYEVHADKHDLIKDADGNLLLATDGGVYKSDFNFDWFDIEETPSTQFYNVTYNQSNPSEIYGGAQDNGTSFGSFEAPNKWKKAFGGDGFQAYVLSDTEYYVETQNGFISYFKDDNEVYPLQDLDIDRTNWNTPYILSPHDQTTLYLGTHKILKGKNNDGEFNWIEISDDLTDGNIYGKNYHTITSVSESKIKPGLLYVGTTDGNLWRMEDDQWTSITQDLPEEYITTVKPGVDDVKNVFTTISGYKYNDFSPKVYMSSDKGENWKSIHSNLPDASINDIIIYPNSNDSILVVANDIGVYASLNQGNSWDRIGNNMPNIMVLDVIFNMEMNTLIAGTHARSIVSFPIDSILSAIESPVVTKNSEFASDIELYPNPVTNTLNLNSDNLTIKEVSCFLSNGRLLFQKEMTQAERTIDFTNVENGIYYLKILTNQGFISKKVQVQH